MAFNLLFECILGSAIFKQIWELLGTNNIFEFLNGKIVEY